MDALLRLLTFYNQTETNSTYRKIAEELLKNISVFPEKSSYEMAELCYAAPSTLRKLVGKIGYSSYTDFRAEIKWVLENYQSLYRYRPIIYGDLEESSTMLLHYIEGLTKQIQNELNIDELNQIVSILASAKRIAIICNSNSIHVQRLELDMLQRGQYVLLYSSRQQMQSENQKFDFLINIQSEVVFDDSSLTAVRAWRRKGIQVLTITNSDYFKSSDLNGFVMSFRGSQSLMDMFGIDILTALLVSAHQEYLTSYSFQNHA